jgi:hypothetical protein
VDVLVAGLARITRAATSSGASLGGRLEDSHMTVSKWSLPKLLMVAVAWVVGFPLLLLVALVLGVGNVGFTIPSLVVLLVVWWGPVGWLVARWRRGRGNRVVGGAA